MQVVKLIKEDWPIVLATVRISTLKSFITKVLEYEMEELNFYALLCMESLLT